MNQRLRIICWCGLVCAAGTACAQQSIRITAANSADSSGMPVSDLRGEPLALGERPAVPLDYASAAPPPNLAALLRPRFSIAVESQAEVDAVELSSYTAKVQMPTFPIFGPPPPFINAAFSYTDLAAPATFGLPAGLYDYSVGASWLRPIHERWMLRFMFSTALATDGNNNSSDAWQFRGGLFAVYRPSEEWTWILGAIALGRNDLPVVPAVGAIWRPNPAIRFDLTFPKPKVAWLLRDTGLRQQWAYLGAGLNGGTWAYERAGGIDDELTYRDWRVVIGWESTPTPEPGMPFTVGRKFDVEFGYVFAREFEIDSGLPDIRLGDTVMLRASASF